MSDTPLIPPDLTASPAAFEAGTGAQSPEQLRTLAAQFESLLLTQLLNTMRSSMFGDDQTADSGFAKGPLADALYGELSLALSRSGGVGLGEMMMAPLLKQAGVEGMAGITGVAVDAETAGALNTNPSAMDTAEAPAMNLAPPAMTALLSARVTSGYGWRHDPFDGSTRLHKGTDIAMAVGQDVPAARAGEVAFVGEQSGYGLTVMINHDAGRSTRYAHLSEAVVKVGETVAEGQVIARSGASGRATGPHLHFELLENGQPVDPAGRLGLLGRAIQISD